MPHNTFKTLFEHFSIFRNTEKIMENIAQGYTNIGVGVRGKLRAVSGDCGLTRSSGIQKIEQEAERKNKKTKKTGHKFWMLETQTGNLVYSLTKRWQS